jgi:adenosylcobinamide kinase/adenosylcobinamide-phosphate guanylyltransferase
MKTLILGGVKSGKSRFAEKQALAFSKQLDAAVVYLATAVAGDEEITDRIRQHQTDRDNHPQKSSWQTLECNQTPESLSQTLTQLSSASKQSANNPPIVLIDCLTLWITQLLSLPTSDIDLVLENFLQTLSNSALKIIIVSNESGLGITPLGELSRQYLDIIGSFHQRLAAHCDQVTLMVAGLPVSIKPLRS